MKRINVLLFFLFILSISSISIDKMNLSNNNGQTAIHFMIVGSSDSILIEANGHYGLVDSGNPY